MALVGGADPQPDSLKQALKNGAVWMGAPVLNKHGDWKPTSCPGRELSLWVDSGAPVVLKMGDRLLSLMTPRMKGSDVKELQQRLIDLGYDLGKWGADGVFGPDTASAIRHFQAREGLKVDGIAGYNTFTALKADRRPDPIDVVREVAIGATNEQDYTYARMLGGAHGFAAVHPLPDGKWQQTYPDGRQINDVDQVSYIVGIGKDAQSLVEKVGDGMTVVGRHRFETEGLVVDLIRDEDVPRRRPWASAA